MARSRQRTMVPRLCSGCAARPGRRAARRGWRRQGGRWLRVRETADHPGAPRDERRPLRGDARPPQAPRGDAPVEPVQGDVGAGRVDRAAPNAGETDRHRARRRGGPDGGHRFERAEARATQGMGVDRAGRGGCGRSTGPSHATPAASMTAGPTGTATAGALGPSPLSPPAGPWAAIAPPVETRCHPAIVVPPLRTLGRDPAPTTSATARPAVSCACPSATSGRRCRAGEMLQQVGADPAPDGDGLPAAHAVRPIRPRREGRVRTDHARWRPCGIGDALEACRRSRGA